jgi:hypothetical protein
MKTLDDIVEMVCTIGMLVFILLFFALLITDVNFNNGGRMTVTLIIFWVLFFIRKYVSDSTNVNENPVPEEGRLIRITWLKHCRNVSSNIQNPYIGMVGRVCNVKPDG